MCSSKTSKKVAMVTGGASGIGTATCRRFAREGYIPVIVDVNLEAAEPLAAELGGMAVQTDVTSYDACVAAAKKVYEAYGRIDILVCCAGGASGRMLNMPGKFHEVPISRLEWGINLNLMGAMYMAHAVVNYMVEAKYGKIVFLGSVAGVVGAIGGAGALLARCIKKSELIAWEDLQSEALRRLWVENMPLVVVIDCYGNDLYEQGRAAYLASR